MGYRDNLKNRALPHARLADFYTVKVVYFCSGEWCVFIPALTDFQKGLTAAQSGDFATALREWTPFAKQGDADAQRTFIRI